MGPKPQSNADKFLAVFSEVEWFLRKSAQGSRHDRFSELVSKVARSNALARRYKDALREFADLRNAIVHERTDGHVIAEPNERALHDFTHIRDVLLRPPKVVPRFGGKVLTKQQDDSVGDAVVAMRESSFSQVPIVSGQDVKAVLTSDTVSRWLAHESSNDLVSLLETRIEEVLPHTEDPEHYAVVSQEATLVDVLGVFEDFASRGKVLNAILISSSGQTRLPLVGIMTVHDLPAVLSSLKIQRSSIA